LTKTHIEANVPSTLSGDLNGLRQILANLIGNAVKFTEEGSINLRIFCPDEDHWALQVSDTGPGIPDEAQAHVFDAFWQLDGTATRRHSGFGLGLSIVKQLTTLMGGEVILESKVGQGTTFTVLLPLHEIEETVL
jgi:signal transduction histidine kinase